MLAATRMILLAALAGGLAAAPAAAQQRAVAAAPGAGPQLPPAVLGVSLLPGWREAGGAYVAAVEIRLAPGWHTYWRTPGAAGMPPRFDWSASENLARVAYEWPRPAVFESFGAVSIGYADRLVLPVALTPVAADRPVEARVDLAFGVCKDICIPAEARVTARLSADLAAPTPEERAAIERALAERPLDAAGAGVTRARCALGAGAAGATLTAEVDFASAPRPGVTAVIEAGDRPDLWIGEAETRVEGRRLRAVAPLEAAGPLALDRGALRLTLIEPDRAVDIKGCPAG